MFDKLIENDIVKKNEPMSAHTTFKAGGLADYFALPTDTKVLSELISTCTEENIPYYVIGNGSNLLVSDSGFRGMIICMKNMSCEESFCEERDRLFVNASAGGSLPALAQAVSKRGYKGFEFAAGIPGSVGGAVVMNAGAYGGEIKDVIKSVTVMLADGKVQQMDAMQLQLGYRSSIFMGKEFDGCIIVSASFEFEKGNADDIMQKIDEQARARREKQPVEYPSAGSTFKRPEGYFAGKLIMDSGLAGYSIGGAQVSKKHCGFVINAGGACAGDIYRLMSHVTGTVYEKFGVRLEPEVKLLGEF